jgi:hypothetical protein
MSDLVEISNGFRNFVKSALGFPPGWSQYGDFQQHHAESKPSRCGSAGEEGEAMVPWGHGFFWHIVITIMWGTSSGWWFQR